MQKFNRDVYIVDGARTPFIKAAGKPNPLSASDLAVACGKILLARQPFSPSEIEEVVTGCVAPAPEEVNIARLIALRLGCGDAVPAYTVQRNCASGLQAIDNAAQDIGNGRADLVLTGGTESMSRTPLLYPEDMVAWLASLNASKSLGGKLKTALKFRPHYLKPIISLLKGLTDPYVNLSMGQTAEILAYQFDITRKEMDQFSAESHLKVLKAEKEKYFQERVPLFDWTEKLIEKDNGVRTDSTPEKLGTLRPVFDKPFGLVTAGNSSQVTDGAALLLLASEDAVNRYQLPVLAKIVDVAWAALSPAVMGLGPVHAIAKLLSNNGLEMSDIDYWEINEAFAAQVLACLKAMENEQYGQKYLGLDGALGSLDPDKLNIDGGAIAVGHPVGASGARLSLHLSHILNRTNSRFGIASLCIGGGQGGAILLERMEGNI